MDIQEFAERFPQRMKKLKDFVENEAPVIMGNEAINHFKESFVNEGFTDETLEKWPEVERRKPDSPWYGHTSDKENKYFLASRTTAKILTNSEQLGEGFRKEFIPGGVKIINDKPYAAVHQRGLPAKIYGKTPFTMPRRRFVGKSKVMIRNINNELLTEIKKIIKGK